MVLSIFWALGLQRTTQKNSCTICRPSARTDTAVTGGLTIRQGTRTDIIMGGAVLSVLGATTVQCAVWKYLGSSILISKPCHTVRVSLIIGNVNSFAFTGSGRRQVIQNLRMGFFSWFTIGLIFPSRYNTSYSNNNSVNRIERIHRQNTPRILWTQKDSFSTTTSFIYCRCHVILWYRCHSIWIIVTRTAFNKLKPF